MAERTRYKQKIKEKGYKQSEVAPIIERSPSALSSYLNGKRELDFYNTTLFIKFAYDTEQEFVDEMKKICLEIEIPENLQAAIEFASFREQTDILEKLIGMIKHTTEDSSREWGRVYLIHLQYLKGEITAIEMSEKARYLTVKNEKLVFMQKWMDAMGSYLADEFSHLPSLLRDMETAIEKHKDPYIVKTYVTRLNLLSGNFNLFNSNIAEAEEAYNKVVDNSTYIQKVAHAYHGLGTRHMYTSYAKSKEYFKKAIEIYKVLNQTNFIKNVKNSLNIMSNLHSENDIYVYDNSIEVDLELAHKAIIQYKKNEADMILSRINVDQLGTRQKAYYFLYFGMLHDDIDALYDSVRYFKDKSYNNKFFSLMPIFELYRRGERPSTLFALYGEEINFSEFAIS